MRLDQDGVLDILLAGDLNPTLRAELPGAMRSAITDDTAPAAAPAAARQGPDRDPRRARCRAPLDEADSDALFAATRCEESAFPGIATRPPTQRASQAVAAARAHPATDFQPFDYTVALRSELGARLRRLARREPAARAARGRCRTVPTLILSGGSTCARRVEDAPSVAARIPGAQLVVVPFTGHSVVGSDLGDCAKNALAAFFAGQPAAQCPARQAGHRAVARSRRRGCRTPARPHERAAKTVAAVSATRARRQAASSSATRSPPARDAASARRSRACAPATRAATSARDQPAPRPVRARRARERRRPGRRRAARR